MFNKFVLLKSCRLSDNVENNTVQADKPHDSIIQRMRIAYWITKATNTHPQYVIFFAFSTATLVTRTRLNVTLHVHCPSCCNYYSQHNFIYGFNWLAFVIDTERSVHEV